MKLAPSGRRTALALAAAALAFTGNALAFQRSGATPLENPQAVPSAAGATDRLVVKYRDAVNLSAPSRETAMRATATGSRFGVRISHERRSATGAHVFRLDRRLSLEQLQSLAQELKSGDANVEYAEPDLMLQPLTAPSDSYYGKQWSLFDAVAGINVPTAWDKSTGGGVVVAVIDTGVRPHADLALKLLPGYDFISDAVKISNDKDGRDGDASDPGDGTAADFCYSGAPARNSSWHGTHVAGTVAALTNNGIGVAGVAPDAKVLPVRVLGRCGGYMSDISDGLLWAAGGTVLGVPKNPNPARVLNLSLGGKGSCSITMQNAINTARSRGAVVVVAAGNDNTDAGNVLPANCSGVITVAATGRTGGKAPYSNFGTVVDLAAPGGESGYGILSTLNAGTGAPGADNYAYYMGTSMATPHVSGIAALMLQRNPALTADEIETRLKSSARAFPASCSQCGAGIVDANAAVDLSGGSTSSPAPTSGNLAEVEPNNGLSSAQLVEGLPRTVDGTVQASSDTDFFKFMVPAGGKVTVTLSPNTQSNYDLYLYSQAGRLIAVSQKGTGQVERITLSNTSAEPAAAYARVVHVSGLTGSGLGSYQLKLAR